MGVCDQRRLGPIREVGVHRIGLVRVAEVGQGNRCLHSRSRRVFNSFDKISHFNSNLRNSRQPVLFRWKGCSKFDDLRKNTLNFEILPAPKLVDGVEPRLSAANLGESKLQEFRESRNSRQHGIAFEQALFFGRFEVDGLAQRVDKPFIVEAIEKL